MSPLLNEGLLAWLAVLLFGSSTGLAVAALFGKRKRSWWAAAARWGLGGGGYLLLLALTARGLQAGGWPLYSTYETALLTAAVTALIFALSVPRRLAVVGGTCAGLAATTTAILSLLLNPEGGRLPSPPPPALGGIWFPLHVLTTAVGYGGLILAGCAGLGRLLRWDQEIIDPDDRHFVRPEVWEAVAHYGLYWGYPGLTLGMTIGAVWSWTAWGTYWSWSVKEVLTLLAWGLFTLAFHTRRLRGWRTWPQAILLVAGLVALLLTFLAAGAIGRQVNPTMQYVF